VACPYFLPEGKLETGPGTHAPRLPLGAAFQGVCLAQPGEPHTPPEQHQQELCNCGYARGRCERFPVDSAADAVRFSVIEDTRAGLRLVYIFEKDHAPSEFGPIEFSIADHEFCIPAPNPIVARQVTVFIEAYLARTSGVRAAGSGD